MSCAEQRPPDERAETDRYAKLAAALYRGFSDNFDPDERRHRLTLALDGDDLAIILNAARAAQ